QGSGLYGSAEYLLWWIKGDRTPPLLTTGPAATFGVLGQPGTQVLFGGPLDYDTFSGGRFTAGYWFNDPQTLGVEGSFFFLGQQTVNFSAASNSMGLPVLSRPFTDTVIGPTVEQVAFPGESAGSVAINAHSQLWSAEADLRWDPFCFT